MSLDLLPKTQSDEELIKFYLEEIQSFIKNYFETAKRFLGYLQENSREIIEDDLEDEEDEDSVSKNIKGY